MVSTIEALRDGIVVNMPSQGRYFSSSRAETLQARTIRLKSTKWSNKRLGALRFHSVGTALPKGALFPIPWFNSSLKAVKTFS